MYKVKSGTYDKLIVINKSGNLTVNIRTDEGDLLVYSRNKWLYRGRWIKDYKKIAKEQSKLNKKLERENNTLIKKIKKSYG